jgi:type I restriction enzyme S subunit
LWPHQSNQLKTSRPPEDGYFVTDKKVSVGIEVTEENYLADGDITLARTGASVGKSYKYKKEDGRLVFAGFLIRVKPDPKKIDSTFLSNFLCTQEYWEWVYVTSARSGQPGINGSEYASLPVPIPPSNPETKLLEQQKIADCLSSLDELITAEAQKRDTLRAYKKGLMQQLFPSEGETLPKLRFPEFRDAGAWESKFISDVVKSVQTGKLDANAMVEDGQYRFYTCAKNYYRINDYAFDGEALLIAGNGAYLGYIHHYIGKFNAYQRTYVLQDFNINVAFLKYYLERNLPYRISLEKKDGNTPYIVLSTITEMPLSIPRDDGEQQKIADCLSSLDELIAAQTQKLELLKEHKKGLMQQLFPALDEVNA